MEPIVGRNVRLGCIGFGQRGKGQTKMLVDMPGVEVVSVCDVLPHRIKEGKEIVKNASGKEPVGYSDYRELIKAGGIDAVMIFTSWQTHIKIAIHAMRAGLYAAMEVFGASSLRECWQLVETYEETGVPCMMLENANYGKWSMTTMRMVREGLFGELVALGGGYKHDLRDEIGLGREIHHYRYDHFVNRSAELYPTHEIGPLAKLININRGNRFMTLVAVASKARGLATWYKNDRKAWNPWVTRELENNYDGVMPCEQKDYDMIGKAINCGDVVTAIIKCAGGETITLVHDNTLPRPMQKGWLVQGDKGLYCGDADKIYLDKVSPLEQWEEAKGYYEKYEHPLITETVGNKDKGSHGGTDHLCMEAFIDAVRRGIQTPIDVYDAAAWVAITVLSEESIAMGGHPVAFPDFTSGGWLNREPQPRSKYSLSDVHWECFDKK